MFRSRSRPEPPFLAGVGADLLNRWIQSRLQEQKALEPERIKNWSAPQHSFYTTAYRNVPVILPLQKHNFLLIGGSCGWSSRGGSACCGPATGSCTPPGTAEQHASAKETREALGFFFI